MNRYINGHVIGRIKLAPEGKGCPTERSKALKWLMGQPWSYCVAPKDDWRFAKVNSKLRFGPIADIPQVVLSTEEMKQIMQDGFLCIDNMKLDKRGNLICASGGWEQYGQDGTKEVYVPKERRTSTVKDWSEQR